MPDNVLKGVLDAIAESDNEIGGQLITRLSEAHRAGRDDGATIAATDELTSPVDAWEAGDVGRGVDIIVPFTGTPHGDEGSYVISVFNSATSVDVTYVDGAAVSFSSADPARWRFSDLHVETTLGFKDRDAQLWLWVGEERKPVYYAELDNTPGAQRFKGLGAHRYYARGDIDGSAATTLSAAGAFFAAGDVGKEVYVLPLATPNGNEGPQRITAVAADGKSCTVTPGGLSTDEELVRFVIKDYLDDTGYPSGLTTHRPSEQLPIRELSEVVDGSQSYSALDQLRRSMLTDFAEEEELDRIGRNLAVFRPRGMNDETYRCLLQVLSYLPKTTVYGLELLLECLFPGGGASVYEDLIAFPNLVFILVDSVAGDSTEFEGKAFLAPTGADVTPSIDPNKVGGTAVGRGSRELVDSDSTTQVTVAHTPEDQVVDVLIEDAEVVLEMAVLPSADTPAWTYTQAADSAPAEGTIFAVLATGTDEAGDTTYVLQHDIDTPPSDDSGRYEYTSPTLASPLHGSINKITAWFKISSHTASNGWPWSLLIEDHQIGKVLGFHWGLTQAELDNESPGGGAAGPVTHGIDLDDGDWHLMTLQRETVADKHLITASIDGKDLFGEVDSSVFAASVADLVAFGHYYQFAVDQNWTVLWDRVRLFVREGRNYYNVMGSDGSFPGSNVTFNTVSTPFAGVGDEGKFLRIHSPGIAGDDGRINVGLWAVKTYISTSSVELEGIVSGDIASVHSEDGGSTNFITLLDPLFVPDDVGKEIEISGSSEGNDGERVVLAYISPYQVQVDGLDYVTESGLAFHFNPWDGFLTDQFYASASGVVWELIDASSFTGAVLTLRDALPNALTATEVWYTTIKSAQILRNEFVRNDGSAGAAPDIYYPFYVFDVDQATRDLINEVTAAGVIPAYAKEF